MSGSDAVWVEVQLFRNDKSIVSRLTELPQPDKHLHILWGFFSNNSLIKTVIISCCGSESNDGVYDGGGIDGCETIDHWNDHSIFLTVVAAIQREETMDVNHIPKINSKTGYQD